MRAPALAAAAALALSLLAAVPAAPAAAYGGWREMLQPGNARPCRYEDSRLCVWDARHRGNGRGHSFAADRRGRVHPISHRTAHRALHG
ncbi:hypothetical protein [Nocardioides dongkuii]|uniref:hypothetical protein n=1 Tax=Nocardioides dongkuii TaxID=2760089 RepID=UPI0015FB003F|nr:hypothetical protein [Nocardioides dongkuii]